MENNSVTIHEMLIKPEYFYLVAKGEKIYEVRTNDSRRKVMKIGDYIKMLKEPEKKEYLILSIKNKIEFQNFTTLYDFFPKEEVGFKGKSTAEIVNELRRFYTEEQENEVGAVAIEVEVIKELSDYIELDKPNTIHL